MGQSKISAPHTDRHVATGKTLKVYGCAKIVRIRFERRHVTIAAFNVLCTDALLQWICIAPFQMNTMLENYAFHLRFISVFTALHLYCILSSIICRCSPSKNCFSLKFVFRNSFMCIRYQYKLFGLPTKGACPSTNNHFIAPPYNLGPHFISPCTFIHFHRSIAKTEMKKNEDLFSKMRNLLLCAGKSERCPIG